MCRGVAYDTLLRNSQGCFSNWNPPKVQKPFDVVGGLLNWYIKRNTLNVTKYLSGPLHLEFKVMDGQFSLSRLWVEWIFGTMASNWSFQSMIAMFCFSYLQPFFIFLEGWITWVCILTKGRRPSNAICLIKYLWTFLSYMHVSFQLLLISIHLSQHNLLEGRLKDLLTISLLYGKTLHHVSQLSSNSLDSQTPLVLPEQDIIQKNSHVALIFKRMSPSSFEAYNTGKHKENTITVQHRIILGLTTTFLWTSLLASRWESHRLLLPFMWDFKTIWNGKRMWCFDGQSLEFYGNQLMICES